MDIPAPQPEHRWLQQMVGAWTYEGVAPMGPGEAPMKSTGTEQVRAIGGLWIVGEGQGAMPNGEPATTLMTLGYDTLRRRYTGTFVGSMMTYLWVYDGELDAGRNLLTLHAEGPSFDGTNRIVKYRDVMAIEGPDARTLTSHAQGDDGQWVHIMTMRYRRR